MQHGGMMVEHDGIVFLSVDVNDFFALGDGGQRLVDDLESFQRFGRGVELAEAAVDQNQAGQRLLFFCRAACSGA